MQGMLPPAQIRVRLSLRLGDIHESQQLYASPNLEMTSSNTRRIAATVGVVLLLTAQWWCALFGVDLYIVKSGSMQPAIEKGSVVLARGTSMEHVETGDIVTFHHPFQPKALVTHRVVQIEAKNNRQVLTTKGDANAVPDGWRVTADQLVGKEFATIPFVGFVLVFVHSPPVLIGMVVVAAVILWPDRKIASPETGSAADTTK